MANEVLEQLFDDVIGSKTPPTIDFRANPLDLNNPIGFDRFSKSREVIVGSNFEKIEEKQV